MGGVRKRGETIREYILQNVTARSTDITSVTSKKFGITRQAVNHHIRRLVDQNSLSVSGTRSRPIYRLCPEAQFEYNIVLDGTQEEDVLWRDIALQHLQDLPSEAIGIWQYGFTEMVNNAIDHSEGTHIDIFVDRFRHHLDIYVSDDGVGIFKKIKAAMNLDDERHAVLELAKGKFTTDPDNHTGEGIFFTSRIFDEFAILSGDVYYAHDFEDPTEWIAQTVKPRKGTIVHMRLKNDCNREITEVFDEYASPEDYAFSKTVVPVELAQYDDDSLVSRSQAKRLLTRIDRFTKVIFDFENVESIGHSFADEVFRVFANRHPKIKISVIHDRPKVRKMISRARSPR
ncbi:MAG: DUF4325 domain-containing protein [Proteobacteria bacterium]|nr:DUF4325 domain-containing protein [Pseudomonadota bacterium]